ncbi:MFS transporter [Streptomyces shenzhenensis]|uniref:MFS transporter n=1 Tax=Streptomyces shenzhenensis TaxID=943815 RepID=A0A3M0HZD8_9ACTN|nr:MFS transporter [Streptomyces shenzhenensis]RMB81112.1 MFS transporter [Streptomyces shenzhenensis]
MASSSAEHIAGHPEPAQPPGTVVEPKQLRRAVIAAGVGSALEYYDFYIYGLASAVIFGPLFFSGLGSDSAALLGALGTYAVGFCARPVGGVIFGAVGDRYGRKAVLMSTVTLMGVASFLVGCLPTYDSIGVAAPILLVCLRVMQGLGAGAEQASAITLVSEFAPPERRGMFASLPYIGIQAGTLLGAGVFAILGATNEDLLLDWLWRLPFLASAVLIVVAVVIRLHMQESPAFKAMESESELVKNPIREVLRESRPNVLRAIGLRMAENGNSSVYLTLVVAFVAGIEAYDGNGALGSEAVAIGAAIAAVTVVLFGRLSDRIGRVRMYRVGTIIQLVFALPGFYLISLGHAWLVLAVVGFGFGVAVQAVTGPHCALLPELFGASRRLTGVAMSREISAVLAGGFAPLLGAVLLSATDWAWWSIGAYSALFALISLLTTFVTPETRGRDLLNTEDAR